MKHGIYIFRTIVILLFSMLSFSCEDYLDKEAEENLDMQTVFSSEAYTYRYLTSVYQSVPIMTAMEQNSIQNPFVGASDEMEITYLGAFCNMMNSGSWGPSNLPTYRNKTIIWGLLYEGVRKANIFLENIDGAPVSDEKKRKWKGEALFLRAFYHFLIAECYGPIPIVDKVYSVDEDFTTIERQPIDVVFNFIASECDKAADLLDAKLSKNDYGRASKVSALALKSRALLYLASPLWNGNSDYVNFTSKGKRLVPDYDKNRWQVAYKAAKECIDVSDAAGYALYRSESNDPVENYSGIFLNNHNIEVLFARNVEYETQFEACANPLSQGGFSIYCPTQEMVDAYEMTNGESPVLGYNGIYPVFNTKAGYNESGFASTAHPKGYYPAGISKMYVNREPRFYASINYSGAAWKNRPLELWFDGIDGRSKAGYDYCITGYLLKKMVDPTSDILQWVSRKKAYIFFRLAEVYLNYAEALNEYEGPVSDVYTYVNKIRERSGLPDLPTGLSQDQMREKIRHERRIELAFEAHRYFDVRRWNIAKSSEDKTISGMNVAAGKYLADPDYYQRTAVEKRIFEYPKHNLWPIPQSEINKYPNIVQNPKY